MPNMRMDKNPMPEQCPNVRNKNFLEVTTGYTEEMAIDEAQRCLNCKWPGQAGHRPAHPGLRPGRARQHCQGCQGRKRRYRQT